MSHHTHARARAHTHTHTHYIVQQGKVNALALMKDNDRLALLKEVAGTRYVCVCARACVCVCACVKDNDRLALLKEVAPEPELVCEQCLNPMREVGELIKCNHHCEKMLCADCYPPPAHEPCCGPRPIQASPSNRPAPRQVRARRQRSNKGVC